MYISSLAIEMGVAMIFDYKKRASKQPTTAETSWSQAVGFVLSTGVLYFCSFELNLFPCFSTENLFLCGEALTVDGL